MFILNHIAQKPNCDPQQPWAKGATMKENSNTQAGTYHLLEGLSNLLLPFQPVTPLSSMEEGKLTSTSTSTLHSAVLLPNPEHSINDVLSLSATKASQVVLESLDKDGKI
jgi:hypothetical protein